MPRSKEQSEQMRAQSRAQIVAAARRLFAERGYYTCKVAEIAREAGMSTGNVYWYYDGKQSVLQAVLADGFEAHEALLRQAAAHPGTAQAKLKHLVERYVAFYREQSQFFTVLLSILSHSGAPYLQELGFDMREIGASYHRHLTGILAQGQVEGTILDQEPDLLATLFFSLFNGLLLTYGEEGWRRLSPDALRSAVLRLVGAEQAS